MTSGRRVGTVRSVPFERCEGVPGRTDTSPLVVKNPSTSGHPSDLLGALLTERLVGMGFVHLPASSAFYCTADLSFLHGAGKSL